MDDNQWEPDEEFFVKLTLIPGTESELVRLGKTCITEITILNDDGKSLEGPFNVCHGRGLKRKSSQGSLSSHICNNKLVRSSSLVLR